jgi:hypothetical protein
VSRSRAWCSSGVRGVGPVRVSGALSLSWHRLSVTILISALLDLGRYNAIGLCPPDGKGTTWLRRHFFEQNFERLKSVDAFICIMPAAVRSPPTSPRTRAPEAAFAKAEERTSWDRCLAFASR